MMGRLGLRASELIHCVEAWVDWRNRRIIIPRQQDGHLGRRLPTARKYSAGSTARTAGTKHHHNTYTAMNGESLPSLEAIKRYGPAVFEFF